MFYYVLGIKISDMEDSKTPGRVIPITEDIFNPDIQVMNQKIIRHTFPNATNEFIKNAITENLMSPVMLYPSMYVNDDSISTLIDPIVDYAIFTKMTSNIKHQFTEDLLFDTLNTSIFEIMDSGFNAIKSNQFQYQETVKLRTIKVQDDQTPKILVAIVSWKMSLDHEMYVTINPDKSDTIYEAIMSNLVYLNKSDLKKIKVGFKVKIGFLDIVEDKFESLVNYNPVMYDVDLSKKQNIRIFQYAENQFIANLVNSGMEKHKLGKLKKIATNRKMIKIK